MNDTDLFIDEGQIAPSSSQDHYSSIQYRHLQDESISNLTDNKSEPTSDDISNETIGNDEFIEKNCTIKRYNWSSTEQSTHGLPPSGKRTNVDHLTINKNSNRIRMKSRAMKNNQLQPSYSIFRERPATFHEKYDHFPIDELLRQTLVRF